MIVAAQQIEPYEGRIVLIGPPSDSDDVAELARQFDKDRPDHEVDGATVELVEDGLVGWKYNKIVEVVGEGVFYMVKDDPQQSVDRLSKVKE